MSKITKERLNEILREEIARERNEQIAINELFGLGSFGSGFIDSISSGDGIFGGAIKEKILASLLKSMGMTDQSAINVFSQILQQFTLTDLKSIWQGGAEQCPLATEKIFQGLCQVLGKEIHDKLVSATSEVPVIGVFSTWLGGGGLLNRATSALSSETIQIQLSSPDTQVGGWMHANILPPLTEKVCSVITEFQSKSMVDIALGREGTVAAAAVGGADVDIDTDIDADASFTTPELSI